MGTRDLWSGQHRSSVRRLQSAPVQLTSHGRNLALTLSSSTRLRPPDPPPAWNLRHTHVRRRTPSPSMPTSSSSSVATRRRPHINSMRVTPHTSNHHAALSSSLPLDPQLGQVNQDPSRIWSSHWRITYQATRRRQHHTQANNNSWRERKRVVNHPANRGL